MYCLLHSHKVPKNLDAAIAAAMESDGGFAVTKFNMNEERQEGNIDAEVRGWVGGGGGRGAGGGAGWWWWWWWVVMGVVGGGGRGAS